MLQIYSTSWENQNNGTYFNVYHGTVGNTADASTRTDHLYSIENITGGMLDDVIRGDDSNNTITSGGGNDTLAGRGGADTFVLTGGLNVIEDYSSAEGDVIKINVDSYSNANVSDWYRTHGRNTGTMDVRFKTGDDQVKVAVKLEGVTSDDPHWIQLVNSDGKVLRNFDYRHNSSSLADPLDEADDLSPSAPILPDDGLGPVDPITGTAGNDVLMGTEQADTFHWSAGDDVVSGFSFEHGDLFHITADTSYTVLQSGADAQLVTDFGTTTFTGVSADQLVEGQSVVIV
nr:hypothetical protein [Synechococcus sp. RSCCF101]